MKEEWLVFKINGKEKVAYTVRGSFPGEAEHTIKLLATFSGCKPEDVQVEVVKR